jgi:RimJ/RimL family protein N-acetyltransferase
VELRDGDLLLRRYAAGDAEALVAVLNDEEIARFIPLVPQPYTRREADAWVARCNDVWHERDSYPFAIVDADSGELLGSVELHASAGSIGYWIAAGARRRGIATRAVRLVCGWWRERPVRLVTHPDNVASQRVAEKAGFRLVGTELHEQAFRDGSAEVVVFRLD